MKAIILSVFFIIFFQTSSFADVKRGQFYDTTWYGEGQEYFLNMNLRINPKGSWSLSFDTSDGLFGFEDGSHFSISSHYGSETKMNILVLWQNQVIVRAFQILSDSNKSLVLKLEDIRLKKQSH